MGSANNWSWQRPRLSALMISALALVCTTWALLDVLDIGVMSAPPPQPMSHGPQETALTAMPSAPTGSDWIFVAGLNVQTEGAGPDIVMRLTATGASQRHALGLMSSTFRPGTAFRVTAEVRSAARSGGVYIEARDTPKSNGVPTHYVAVYFDLHTESVSGISGDWVSRGIETEDGGWDKIWLEQQSEDGTAFVMIALLEANNALEFQGSGQTILLRHLTITPVRSPS